MMILQNSGKTKTAEKIVRRNLKRIFFLLHVTSKDQRSIKRLYKQLCITLYEEGKKELMK